MGDAVRRVDDAVRRTPTRRADVALAEGELDAHLQRTVRRTSLMRQGFYVVVLLVALAGQVSGAVEVLGIPLVAAIPAVAALELGGIVVLANADVRRRLGERAIASRILSAAIAATAVTYNWLAHSNRLLGGFFAGMSALGYLVWLMHTENQRRDRLRAKGALPPTSPAYEVIGHWLRHPWLTARAKALAKAHPQLGLYESLAAARGEVRRERQQRAIAKVLHRKIRAAVDPVTADIAVAVYDIDEIATRLADGADYDGLTALIAADLAPERLGITDAPVPPRERPPVVVASTTMPLDPVPPAVTGDTVGEEPASALPPAVRRDIEAFLESARSMAASAHQEIEPAREEWAATNGRAHDNAAPAIRAASNGVPTNGNGASAGSNGANAGSNGASVVGAIVREGSLRSRVRAALDAKVRAGDEHDTNALTALVAETLQLSEGERAHAATHVRTWRRDMAARHRSAPAARAERA
jgi:hypothetical protein